MNKFFAHIFSQIFNLKGSEREAATLALLQKFQQKLSGVRNKAPEEAMETNQDDDDDLKNDDSWYLQLK